MFLDTDEKRVLVPLEDEDGNEVIYERIDLVEYLEYTFGIFLPVMVSVPLNTCSS